MSGYPRATQASLPELVMRFSRLAVGALLLLGLGLPSPPATALDQARSPTGQVSPPLAQKAPTTAETMRVIVVEWRIKKDSESEFLEYWSKQSTIPDRQGLIGEFLSRVDDRTAYPWMVWAFDERWTTFLNIGFWREGADFQQQVGRHIDNSRPPMSFEADRRRRILLAPVRWRLGETALPVTDHLEVQ